MKKLCYNTSCSAGVAHPVERHLAKVEVASSSLVTRSIKKKDHTFVWSFFFMELVGGRFEDLNASLRRQLYSVSSLVTRSVAERYF